jgi:LPS-assembly lipoprotein
MSGLAAARGRVVAAILAAVLTALAAGGCGFRLQGGVTLPRGVALVRIETRDTESDFYTELRKAVLASGGSIDETGRDPAATVIRLDIDSSSDQILTVSALNVPTEYELRYTVRFAVISQGRERIAPESHVLVRDYDFNESALLAKQREQAILTDALARDLVSVLMRRLASLQ